MLHSLLKSLLQNWAIWATLALCLIASFISSVVAPGSSERDAVWLGTTLLALAVGMVAYQTSFFNFNPHPAPADSNRLGPVAPRWYRDPWSILLIGAVIFGTAIRFYGLDFGLPDPYHPDELRKAHVILKMRERDTFNPNYFLHPSLLLYLSAGMASLFRFLEIGEGSIPRVLLAGRSISAAAGSLSLVLVYLIGSRLHSRSAGSLAALVLAVSPLHITCSRYLKEDSLLLMFILLALLFAVKAAQNIRYCYAAAIAIGFAFGTKYTAILAFSFMAIPWLLAEPSSRSKVLRHSVLAAFLIPIAFVCTTPYAVIEWERFLGGFLAEKTHAAKGHRGHVVTAASRMWMYHIERSLSFGVGAAALVVACIAFGSMILGAVKLRFHGGVVLIALCFSLFYLPAEYIPSKPEPQPERYVALCTAFVALGCGVLLAQVRQPQIRFLLVLLIIAAPLRSSLALAREIQPDTRRLARIWIAQNLPPGSRILTMGGTVYLPKIPRAYPHASVRRAVGKGQRRLIERMRSSDYDYLVRTTFLRPGEALYASHDPRMERGFKIVERQLEKVALIAPSYRTYAFHNPTIIIYRLRPASEADDPVEAIR